MRKLTILIFSALYVMTSASVALPADAFYVATAIPPGVGTKIKSLPYTISSPGLYYLGANFSYTLGNAITISAENVVLDLMGFTLQGGNASIGILVAANNAEIRNGTVRNFDTGIEVGNSQPAKSGLHVSHVSTYSCRNGQDLSACENARVVACDSSYNTSYGFAFKTGIISGCTAYANGTGFYLNSAANVLGNSATGNSYRGFDINTSAYVLMDGNMANGNTNANYANSAPSAITWGVNAGR